MSLKLPSDLAPDVMARFEDNSPSIQLTGELSPLGMQFYPNSITIIGGFSGGGKSAMMQQIAVDLTSQGVPVLDLSFEDSSDFRFKRYLQVSAGEDYSISSINNKRCNPTSLNRVMQNFATINPDFGLVMPRQLYIDADCKIKQHVRESIREFITLRNTPEYLNFLTQLNIKPHPPVVIFDFIQCMPDNPDKGGGVYDKLNDSIQFVYDVTREFGLISIVGSQLNRQTKPGFATMQSFEGSGKLEQLSHTAMIIDAVLDSNGRPQTPVSGSVPIHFKVLKNRIGQVKTFSALFEGKNLAFKCISSL